MVCVLDTSAFYSSVISRRGDSEGAKQAINELEQTIGAVASKRA
jgi:hypothetical protein